MTTPTNKVKCADCGILALRKNDRGISFVEVDELVRKDAKHIEAGLQVAPFCAVAAIRIELEYDSSQPSRERDTQFGLNQDMTFRNVILKDRECGFHFHWIPGYSPREHIEMMNAHELRRHLDDQRKDDQAWQKKVSRENAVINGVFLIAGTILGAVLVTLSSCGKDSKSQPPTEPTTTHQARATSPSATKATGRD